MTIAEIRRKCNDFLTSLPRDVLIVAILILASSASFALGFLSGEQSGLADGGITITSSPFATTSLAGEYVASKNGTKYYLPSCAGVNRISEENNIWFATEADAEAAGYSPAAHCIAP